MEKELKYAYAAGIIDGEGALMIGKTADKRFNGYEHYSVVIQVSMTDKAVIDWLGATFGGNTRFRAARTESREEQFQWTLRERRLLLDFIRRIKPYLITKKLHGIIILEFCERFPLRTSQSPEVKSKMAEFFEMMKVANARGPGTMQRKKEFLALIT